MIEFGVIAVGVPVAVYVLAALVKGIAGLLDDGLNDAILTGAIIHLGLTLDPAPLTAVIDSAPSIDQRVIVLLTVILGAAGWLAGIWMSRIRKEAADVTRDAAAIDEFRRQRRLIFAQVLRSTPLSADQAAAVETSIKDDLMVHEDQIVDRARALAPARRWPTFGHMALAAGYLVWMILVWFWLLDL